MEISYSDYMASKNAEANSTKKVQYFDSLKKDGDETLIRLAYDKAEDFKVVPIHRVLDGKRFINVACIREQYEPKETCSCALCRAKNQDKPAYPVKVRTYLNVIEYTKDEEGNIVATPKVWERPSLFIDELIGAFNDGVSNLLYPNTSKLSDVVFKIRRTGSGLSDTKYHAVAGNPAIYPESAYVKDFSAFEGFKASNKSYYIKTPEEMNAFIQTGAWPKEEKKNDKPITAVPVVDTVSVKPATDTTNVQATPTATVQPAPFSASIEGKVKEENNFDEVEESNQPRRFKYSL